VEPTNIKMARLRQSLTRTALEAIRGLGVSEPEYKEAKEILQSKFGGERRKLLAYMDQIEKMPSLKSNDVQSFERFADLVHIAQILFACLRATERSYSPGILIQPNAKRCAFLKRMTTQALNTIYVVVS